MSTHDIGKAFISFYDKKRLQAKHINSDSWSIGSDALGVIVMFVQEQTKAFGGCTNCYGKGYATVRQGETYRGKTHNLRNQVRYCDCPRGQQLSELVELKDGR